jgi:hypothetical protein
MWDLRTPSGYFFLLVGLILCALGLFEPSNRAPMTDCNVNLYVGVALLIFGGALLWMARRRS